MGWARSVSVADGIAVGVTDAGGMAAAVAVRAPPLLGSVEAMGCLAAWLAQLLQLAHLPPRDDDKNDITDVAHVVVPSLDV